MDQTNKEETNESPPESESGWAELTHDCLTNIIARLSLEFRWRAMLVCKSWLLACKDQHLNSCFVLEPAKSLPESTRWWAPEFGRKVDSILRCSPNATDASMAGIAFRCPMIKELDISYCRGISHESLLLIGRSCPNLTILKRNAVKFLDYSIETGVVPSEYLDTNRPQDRDSEADAIGKSMPNLKHLEGNC
ncbi:hypothetical protein ACLB2K_045359 [Fragaria x ananassa]